MKLEQNKYYGRRRIEKISLSRYTCSDHHNNMKHTRTRAKTMIHYCHYVALFTTVLTLLLQSTLAFNNRAFISKAPPIRTNNNNNIPTRLPKTTTRLHLSSQSSDIAEFKAILAALQLYKAAYGNFDVPVKFVVPDLAPWPQPAWGLHLGKAVQAIQKGKYIKNRPQRRQVLEKIGFEIKDESSEATSVRQVPKAPKEQSTKKAAESVSTPQQQQEEEPPIIEPQQRQAERQRATRMRWNLNDITADQLQLALQTYQQLERPLSNSGDGLDIPPDFVVPSNDSSWDDSIQGLPLGRYVESIVPENEPDDTRAVLESFGLVQNVEPQLSANDIRFQKVYTALKTYKKLYGDLLVPQPFEVPVDEKWPRDVWGLRLGARVNAIRSQGTFVNTDPERKQMLVDLGFVWTPPKDTKKTRKSNDERDDDDDDNSAASSFQNALSGDIDSLFDNPFDFGQSFGLDSDGSKPPSWALDNDGSQSLQKAVKAAEEAAQATAEEEYAPEKTLEDSMKVAKARAVEVGIIEPFTDQDARIVKGKRDKDIPWFNDDFGADFVFEDVVEALTIYKSIYNDFRNLTESDEYVVPTPAEVTGFLDDDIYNAFDVDASSRAAQAIANFEEQGLDDRKEDLISAEIRRLTEEVEAEPTKRSAVATDPNADLWPEHLAGMALGNIVARIRDGSLEVKHIPERKAQLDKLGFDWGDPRKFIDVPFEKTMCAMYAYYLVRGDTFVEEDFIMPSEDPWPQILSNFELGQAVKRLRELQNFLEAFHPEKVNLLRMLDFVWFPTAAEPLDPNEPDMDSEMLLLSALGHPDYAKMIDIPMGLPDKIIADGPFYESDDPKDWWRVWHNWDYVKDYWYAQGRRDNAYVLRAMGYPKMAAEHEEKYGPGLFTLIEATRAEIDAGIEGRPVEEKKELLKKINFYRQEMLDCTDIHPQNREELLNEFDEVMTAIMKDPNLELELEEDEKVENVDEKEPVNGYEKASRDNGGDDDEDDDEDEEEFEYEEEEFDVEDELGFGKR